MTITIPTRQLCIQGAKFQTPHMCCLTSRIESISLETELERGSLSDFENTGKGMVIPKEIISMISKTMFFSIHDSKRDECRAGMGRETYMWLTWLLISFGIKCCLLFLLLISEATGRSCALWSDTRKGG